MERKPDNIRSITHDMRNLLTAVRGHAELALRALPADEPAREDVAHVVVVTSTIFDLIDQLDGTDTSSTLAAVNLDSSVGSMRRLLDALLPQTIEMIVAPDSEGAYVTISKLRIERIVLNLALNARDAMEDGGALIIRTRRGHDSNAEIVVSDTGPGFSEEALERLFEVGFTTKAERGGSGHGLSALAGFVDGAGGSITVDSVEGEGATITVSVPLADVGRDDVDDEPVPNEEAASNEDAEADAPLEDGGADGAHASSGDGADDGADPSAGDGADDQG